MLAVLKEQLATFKDCLVRPQWVNEVDDKNDLFKSFGLVCCVYCILLLCIAYLDVTFTILFLLFTVILLALQQDVPITTAVKDHLLHV